jgi:hypothetical protein
VSNRLKKAEKIALESIMPAQDFRTVESELRDLRGGITEIPVTVEFNKDFKPSLKNPISGGCFVHGFIRMNEMLARINGSPYRQNENGNGIKRIYLTDWDGIFLLSVTMIHGSEYLYSVTSEEVEYLLSNCRHPNIIAEV